ncbi:MAG: glycyl radical protein [Salinivirgaceae bacterium]|nr:glycyl radical protein [Salinivirgaceae bacterium]
MKRTNRINILREQSLNAVEHITAERAQLITNFYKSNEAQGLSIPVQRAKAFEYILKNKTICINSGELIVGERGPKPKATPTYPEINLHSIQDLEVLDSRKKVFFKVSNEVKSIYQEEIIPFWKGKSNRERIMNNLFPEWKVAYKAGMFTEFQEQRAPGHTVLGYKMFKTGFLQIINEIQEAKSKIDVLNDADSLDKLNELEAMEIVSKAIIMYAERHSDELIKLAEAEKDLNRQNELIEMARICRKVPAHAPESVHEMLQHYWFIHLGVISELNPWDSFNPGRLDQHLFPVYESDLEKGKSKEEVYELLQSFWVKFNNHPAPPKVGITALESNTYTDFCLINMGGVKPDGSDAVNEMSFMLLDVIEEMRLLQPSSMVQVSKKNPDAFVKRALKIVKTGFGQPSIFNADAIIQELLNQGKDIVDARNGGASGCVETGAFGTESYILTGYFNLLKVLEITLNNGIDPNSGEKIGIESGDPSTFKSMNDLYTAYEKQLNYFIDIKLKGNCIIEQIWAKYLPAPFLSTLIDDCITNAKDYNAGGARYNTSYVQGVGLGTLTDSLTAIKYHVFDKENISLTDFINELKVNFKSKELRHQLIYETPKYGNDDDFADENAIKVFELFYSAVNGKPTPRGGKFRINMLPTTCHVYFGQLTGATPDGRLKGEPTSEGISPVQGADKQGPTSVIKSASKIDHLRTGGTLLNQKFTPSFFEYEGAYENLTALIRSYFKLDGHHIQFNVVNAETLRKAQKEPEKYKDLIVRVAGYSDFFNDLGEDLQNEIIRRTEHSN